MRGDGGGQEDVRDGLEIAFGTRRQLPGHPRCVPPVVHSSLTSYTKGFKRGFLETSRKGCAGTPRRWEEGGGTAGRTGRVLMMH